MPAIYHDSLLRPVPWLDSFGIDDGQVDAEHRLMIALYNEVCSAAVVCPGRARERLLREDATGQMALHFATEERIFDEIGFRDGFLHRREHDHVRLLMTPLLLTTTHDQDFVRTLLHLRTGLVEHIIRHDLGFKSHLLDRDGR